MKLKLLTPENFKKTLGNLSNRAEQLLKDFKDEELEELLFSELHLMQSNCRLLQAMHSELSNYNLRKSIQLENYEEEP